MARLASLFQGKELYLFLNISFLLVLSFYLTTHFYPSNSHNFRNQSKGSSRNITSFVILYESNDEDGCSNLHRYHDYKAKCAYVRSDEGCRSEGYIDYLQLFYCTCGRYPVLGYSVLVLWFTVLFYLLGDTAANYFCSFLESLSTVLKLSPTIAGVTLLSLGNGAPDVFSSIVSFVGTGAGEVGLNSVLGGAFFVSSIVVGIISISVGAHQISIDKSSFIRDVVFFLLVLSSLLLILFFGRINLWGAIIFVSLYFVYVFAVSTSYFYRKKDGDKVNIFPRSPILSPSTSLFAQETEGFDELRTPLLVAYGDDEENLIQNGKDGLEDGDEKKHRTWCSNLDSTNYIGRFLLILELPLYLPRRLTIPVVSEERWSKPFAVISVTLAPLLLAALWNSHGGDIFSKTGLVIYTIGGLAGVTFGVFAYVTTENSYPPKKYLLPWLAGGFLMSVMWTYIIAEELVALLVSLGHVLGINPSILGLTVLAWGNSIGDLIANVAMAVNGGPDGVQVAISGCYAGPIFNTLIGLGLSLVLSAWYAYPSSFVIPSDPSLYETIGFLMSGLFWALAILPNKNMKIERTLGAGLLAMYICFLSLRLARETGLLQLHGSAFPFAPRGGEHTIKDISGSL